MPARSQLLASPPVRSRSSVSAQAAAAQALLERPRVEALFPQLDQEKSAIQAPAPPRALSRASASDPHILSSFGRANAADNDAASQLSAATTAFVPASVLGSAVGSAVRSQTGQPDALAALTASPMKPSVPKEKKQNHFQASMPWHTDQESSIVSDWRVFYQKTEGKGVAFGRGLRFQDLRYNTENSAGVCVLKADDDVPKVPGLATGTFGPVAEKQFVIDAVTKQLLQMGVKVTEPKYGRTYNDAKDASSSSSKQGPAGGFRSRSSSEASIPTALARHKNTASFIARERYQRLVLDKPKKGHEFCKPKLASGKHAEVVRQVYGQ